MCLDESQKRNNDQSLITSRILILVRDSERKEIIISVFRPERSSDNLFTTIVTFSGYIEESHRISGYDEMQAIGIAISFADRRIIDFSDSYIIEWESGSLF